MRAMIAMPSFPFFLYWQNRLTVLTVVVLLTVLAVAWMRGWRPRAIAAVLFSAGAVLGANVFIICGWCCELFGEWLCSQI